MQRIGLTFQEFVDLKLKPPAGADPAFVEAAEMEQAEMFPMSLSQASDHLRARGYDCRTTMLELLMRNKVVTPASPNTWSQADLEVVAEHFEDCEIYSPYAAMCQTLGCSYADFVRPLREAVEQVLAKYGRRVPQNDQYFIMHRQPPRDDTPSIITFTLCDDIRERLERGEEV